MQFLVLIPAFFLVLYSLYKLSKDDYVFIRRNISLEHMFDIAFIVMWISLLFARVVYFIYHPIVDANLFIVFFSPGEGGFSLIGAIIGGILGLYLLGKYKKVPLGRLFDFFTLSLLIALPVGFLGSAVLVRQYQLALGIINTVTYLILTICFMKFLYPKLLNRTMKEGSISIFFLLFFSLISFATSLIDVTKGIQFQVTIQSILPVILFFFSLILLFNHENNRLRVRKYK